MKRAFLLLVPVLLLAASGCRRIPLYDPRSGVYLKPDIHLNTDPPLADDPALEGDPALRDKVRGTMPELLRACFYDAQTHALVADDFLPPEGGFVDLPAGTYDMIVYSLGAEVCRVEETGTRAGACASSSLTEDAGQPVIFEPDHIFAGAKEKIVIPVRAESDAPVRIEVGLTTLLETYALEVRTIRNADRIAKIDVYITGQAPSKYLWDRRLPFRSCAIRLPAEADLEKGVLRVLFNTFGKTPQGLSDVYLNILISSMDGGRYMWVFDMTGQFDNPDNDGHTLIIDQDLTVPEGDLGGFRPDVRDWGEDIIYVPVR